MTDAWGAQLDAAAFGRAAAALATSDSEHLPRVLDVTALGERRELLLGGAGGPTLASLRASRSLAPGEAVTIAVSAGRAVAALHAAGFCGADLSDDSLRFDEAGRPILLGLDKLRETIQTGVEGRADDWRAVASLAERLALLAPSRAGAVLGAQQAAVGLALASLSAVESDEHFALLEDALFDIASPAPVRLDAPPDVVVPSPPYPPSPTVPQQPGPRAIAAAERAASRSRALHRRPSSSAFIEAFDAGPAALLAGPLERAREVVASARSRVTGRGRLFLIAGAAAAVLTVVLVALLPSTPGGVSDRALPSSEPSAQAASRPPTSAPATSGDAKAGDAKAADAALTGDDPVAAASVLITRRDACLTRSTEARAGCLAKVADGGASALDQPARALGGLTPSLLERSGNSALIALTPTSPKTAPTSALLMRTEAGWRLRQLYEN